MKDSRKSSGVSRPAAANLRQVKILSPEDCLSRVEFTSNLSRTNLKKHLSWYVALNTKPAVEKISCVPQIKWKCPHKFTLSTCWLVAAGEGSQEAETQKCRERTVQEVVYSDLTAIPPSPFCLPHVGGECFHASPTPIVPTIPIEEVDATMPSDTSATVNTPVNSQPPASGNLSMSQCDPSGLQDQTVTEKSLPNMLHCLESTDLEVAAAAAATVAAIMENKEHIDTELLIKLLTHPEMAKKLIDGNGLTVKLENVTPPVPEPNTTLPFPSSKPLSVVNDVAPECSVPLGRAIFSHFTTQAVKQSLAPSCSKMEKEMVKKLIDGNGTAKPKNATPVAPKPKKPLPFPSSMPYSVVDKVATECSKALVKEIHRAPPCSEGQSENNRLAIESELSRGSSLPPRSESYFHPLETFIMESQGSAESHIHKTAGTELVIPLMPSMSRPFEETIERLINKYLAPDIAGATSVPPFNPSTSNPKMEEIKKMIHEYGAPDAAQIKPVAPVVDKTIHKNHNYGVDHIHGSRMPFMGPLPTVTNHVLRSYCTAPGNFCFPSSCPASNHPAPKLDLSYHKSLIKQHGETHGSAEQRLPETGQPGNYLRGPVPAHMNPEFRKPCVYFGSSKGCQNGFNCQYPHDLSKKKMRFRW